MPRTNLCKREIPHARIGSLIAGAAMQQRISIGALGEIIGASPNTARARIKTPGSLTIDEYCALCRKLGIPIADARDAIRY